jgi:heme A synthase
VWLVRHRERAPLLFRVGLGLLALLLVQMTVGELQWRTQLPWWLVLVHVALAAGVWAWTVGLATALWRTPASIRRE